MAAALSRTLSDAYRRVISVIRQPPVFTKSELFRTLFKDRCGKKPSSPIASEWCLAQAGRILEIGIGSGVNLRYYCDEAKHVIGLDPSAKLLAIAAEADKRTDLSVELVKGSAEMIPIEDKTMDTVLTTWTLCSISDVNRALSEMRRVLKPNGRLLFVEHGLSPDDKVRRWQNRLNPVWKRVAGGCNLNRAIAQLIEVAGFQIERIDTGYMKGPRPMTFMYEGYARSA